MDLSPSEVCGGNLGLLVRDVIWLSTLTMTVPSETVSSPSDGSGVVPVRGAEGTSYG